MSIAKWILVGVTCVLAAAVAAEASSAEPRRQARERHRNGRRPILPSYFAVIRHAPRSACVLN